MNTENNESLISRLFKTRWSIKKIACAMLVPLGIAAVVMVFVLSSQVALMDDTLPVCGLEEHTHGPDCYDSVSVTGTQTDIKTENETSVLICGLKEHVHNNESCYLHETTTKEEIVKEISAGEKTVTVPYRCFICDDTAPHGHANGSAVYEPTPEPGQSTGIMALSSGDGWDLQNFVTSVTIKDAKGNPVTDGVFYYGDGYTFSINFEERLGAGGQFSYNMFGRMVYQLPAQLSVPQEILSTNPGKILLPNNSVIGFYTIDTSGRIEVWFENKNNQGINTPNGQNFIDYYTNTTFLLNINTEFKQGAASGKIQFGAQAEIDVTFKAPPAGLKVAKSASSINRTTESIDYIITVTATGNEVENIVLTDALTFNIFSNFKIKASDIPGNYPDPVANLRYSVKGGPLTYTSFVAFGDNWQLSFPDVTLQAGESIEIRYTLNLKDILNYLSSQNAIKRYNYNIYLDNTASVKGRDKNNSKDIDGSGRTYTSLTKTILSKSGQYLSASDQINWTATVGDGSVKLNTIPITDTLEDNQTIVPGSMVIKVWGAADSNGSFSEPYTLSSGEISSYLSITNTTGSDSFTFTVPSGGFGGITDVYRIEFVYNTTRPGDPAFTNSTYYNTIGIYDITVRIGVAGPPPPAVEHWYDNISTVKDSKWVWNDDHTDVTDLEYTITIVVPAGLQGQRFFLEDSLYMWGPAVTNGASPYATIINAPHDFTVSVSPEPTGADDDVFLKYTPYCFTNSYNTQDSLSNTGDKTPQEYLSNNGYSVWKLFFNRYAPVNNNTGEGPNADHDYQWPYTEQKTLTITYRIPLDSPIDNRTHLWENDSYKTCYDCITLKDALTHHRGFRVLNQAVLRGATVDGDNNVTVDGLGKYPNGTENAASSAGAYTNDYWPISKIVAVNDANNTAFDYMVYLNPGEWSRKGSHGAYTIYTLFGDGPAIFEDSFDPWLEYVPYSFKVEIYTYHAAGGVTPYGCYWPYSGSGALKNGNITGTYIDDSEPGKIRVDFKELRNGGKNGSNVAYGYDPESTLQESIISSTLFESNNRYMVRYQLRIKEEYKEYYSEINGEANKMTFDNTAQIYATGENVRGPWRSIARAEYTPPKPVTKSMVLAANNSQIALAEIIINPLGKRLRPANIQSPYFTAVDTMSDSLAFYLDSIKIYTKDSNGEWNTTPEPHANPGELWSFELISPQEVRFELKDETPIKIVYEALIIPGESSKHSNTIEVYGEATVYDNTFQVKAGSQASGFGNMVPLQLFKVDEDTGAKLPGATFKLYVAIPSYGYHNEPLGSEPTESIEPIPGKIFYYVCDGTYDPATGAYKFDSNIIAASHNAVYLIEETAAPTNYLLPSNPVTYIALTEANRISWQTELGASVEVKLKSDNIFVTNKSKLTGIVIEGNKTAEVPAGFDKSATFLYELTQVENPAGDPLTGTSVLYDSLYSSVTVSLGNYLNQPFVFPKINGLADGIYYFQIEEIDIPVGWLCLMAPQIVTVEVVDGVASAIYPGGTSKANFTNKYKDPAEHKANITIPVKKTITGSGYVTTPTFTFKIEQIDAGGTPVSSSPYISNANDTITINTEGGMNNFVIQDLIAPATAGAAANSYYFRIWEVQDAGSSDWAYDTSSYVVKASVTYDENKGGVAALTVMSVTPTGHSLTMPLLFDNEFEETSVPTICIEIPVTKTIDGAGYPANKEFTFYIQEGTWSANVFAPKANGMYFIIEITGEGTDSVSIEYLLPGEYYFRIWEDQTGDGVDGWEYDDGEYILKIVVDKNGKATVYNAKTNAVMSVNGLRSTTTWYKPKTEYVHLSGSAIVQEPKHYKYTNSDSVRLLPLERGTGDMFYALGLKYAGIYPDVGTIIDDVSFYPVDDTHNPEWINPITGFPDDSIVWQKQVLAFSLFDKNVGAKLSLAEFNALFGFDGTNGLDPLPNDNIRRALIQHVIWINNTSNATEINVITSEWNFKTGGAYSDHLTKALQTVDEMYSYYCVGIPEVEFNYFPDLMISDSGRITVGYKNYGFVNHDFILTYTGTATITVMRNGGVIPQESDGSFKVRPEDDILVTGISGKVDFKISDTMYYLVSGSIKGTIIKMPDYNPKLAYPPLITGTAEFKKTSTTITISENKIGFENEYEEQGGPQLPETGGNGIWLFMLIGGIFVTFATVAGIFYKRLRPILYKSK